MFVIIAAAGKGQRFGGLKKQFLKVNGRYILSISIEKFLSFGIKNIVVGVSKEDILFTKNITKKYRANIEVFEGENSRQKTISCLFLKNYKKYNLEDFVIVHDAVRPFFDVKDLANLISVAKEKKAAVLGISAVDTIKYVENYKIKKTIPRKNIFFSQTPQIFKISLYKKVLDYTIEKNLEVTDDCQMFENFGFFVPLILGSKKNFKITTKEDLLYAKYLIKKL